MVFKRLGYTTLSRNNVKGEICKIGESLDSENVPPIHQNPTDKSNPHYLDQIFLFFLLTVSLEALITFDKTSMIA